eukprot:m.177673 g.177673  ORF g.177673 m.177673 type:complete len:625 (-) comp17969_c0_seq3:169-2043(-)
MAWASSLRSLLLLLAVAWAAADEHTTDPNPQCTVLTTCRHDPDNKYKELHDMDADECCRWCTQDYKCRSYTAYTVEGTHEMVCNLFSDSQQHSFNGSNCISGTPGARPKRPNFIFVFPDTLRAESFNGYGNPVQNVTPNLDRFAKTGVRFDQAHVMHTQCSPSRCTMLTGRYMHVLGHRTQTHLIQDYENNYFRDLKEAGYHIQYYGKNDAFSQNAFNMSVSNWSSLIGYPSGSNAFPNTSTPGHFSFLYTGSESSGKDEKLSKDAAAHFESIKWLHNSPPEPFVLFVPTRGAHPPYGAPAEWHNKFSVQEVKSKIELRPRNVSGKPKYMTGDGIPHFRNLNPLDEDVFYKIQAVYLSMISYTDWLFGQLLDGLESAPNGLNDRTAVFFSSDHGDFGGDYGLVEKWPGSMSDVLTRVPLYGRIPGGAQGHVSKAPVQTADVLETMLELAMINTSWIRFGNSLTTQLNGGEGEMDRFVYSEGGFYFANEQMAEAGECLSACPNGLYCPRGQEEAQPNGSPRATMIRNLTSKLVYRPTGVSELYDLQSDPREITNQYNNPAYAGLRDELRTKLLDWLLLTSDITPSTYDPRGPPSYPHPVPSDPWNRPLDEEQPPVTDYMKINGVV